MTECRRKNGPFWRSMAGKRTSFIIIIVLLIPFMAFLSWFLYLNVERKYLKWDASAPTLLSTRQQSLVDALPLNDPQILVITTTRSSYRNEEAVRKLPLLCQLRYFLSNRDVFEITPNQLLKRQYITIELLDEVFSTENPWDGFMEAFPNKKGILHLSAPGICGNKAFLTGVMSIPGRSYGYIFNFIRRNDRGYFSSRELICEGSTVF